MEVKTRVVAFRVVLKCSQCDGHMEVLPYAPHADMYPHECDTCKHVMILPMAYPYIEFEDTNE